MFAIRSKRPRRLPSPSSVALYWFDVTRDTVAAAAFPEQATQGRTWAVSWLAAARALDYRDNANLMTAAFVTAIHDVLVAQVPAQTEGLDAARNETLAHVRDQHARAQGIEAGADAARDVLAERAEDGFDATLVTAKPFILARADQSRPLPPPVTARPTSRSASLFWEQGSLAAYTQVLRAVIAQERRSLRWNAELVAAFHAVTLDAQIAMHDAQYPSIHSGYAGAAEVVLRSFVGSTPDSPIAVTSATEPGVVRTFTDWKTITRENIRFSNTVGAQVGKQVAAYDVSHLRLLFEADHERSHRRQVREPV